MSVGMTFFKILVITLPIPAQSKKYPVVIEEKISLVENSLAGCVQTGSNDSWNLAERMKEYNINGVSIAVSFIRQEAGVRRSIILYS